MGNFNTTKAATTYQQAALYGGLESADSHRLIEMLLDGLLKNLGNSKASISENNTMQKCTSIDKTIAILDTLRNGLDFEEGGQLATNLDDLYDYMQRQLIQANFKSDASIIDEVIGLAAQIKDAWHAIGKNNAEKAQAGVLR